MFNMESRTAHQYDVFDGCFAEVTERSGKGIYLRLDNEEEAFSYDTQNLRVGTKVLCTVLRKAKPEENRLMRVSVDSVCYPAWAA